MQVVVSRAVDIAHPTRAEPRLHDIRTDAATDEIGIGLLVDQVCGDLERGHLEE